jgi:hypothetical protein
MTQRIIDEIVETEKAFRVKGLESIARRSISPEVCTKSPECSFIEPGKPCDIVIGTISKYGHKEGFIGCERTQHRIEYR